MATVSSMWWKDSKTIISATLPLLECDLPDGAVDDFVYSEHIVRDATPEEIAAKAEANRIAEEERAERAKPCEHYHEALEWLKANGFSIEAGCGCYGAYLNCSKCGKSTDLYEVLNG